MKRLYINNILSLFVIAAVLLGGCKKVLQEDPRATYTPGFFTTQTGVVGGLTEMYSHLRYIYGQGYYYNTLEVGTDESTYAQSADANYPRSWI